jgi:hypothetical protein
MHDSRLEDRLRSILHTEGDRLPLTITSAELERRLDLRRRRATSRWVSLVAAAVAVIAVGAVIAFGDRWFAPVVGTPPSASPSSDPVETPVEVFPTPVVIPGLGRIAQAPNSNVLFEIEPIVSDGGSGTFHSELDSTVFSVTLKVACLGTGAIDVSVNGRTQAAACQQAAAGRDAADTPVSIDFPIVNQAVAASYTVPDNVPFTFLVEYLPIYSRLPPLETPLGTVAVDAASDSDQPIPGYPGDVVEKIVGRVPASATQRVAIDCLGPGTLTFTLGSPSSPETALVVETLCDGGALEHSNTPTIAGPQDLSISVDARIAWHIIATYEGEPPSAAP